MCRLLATVEYRPSINVHVICIIATDRGILVQLSSHNNRASQPDRDNIRALHTNVVSVSIRYELVLNESIHISEIVPNGWMQT